MHALSVASWHFGCVLFVHSLGCHASLIQHITGFGYGVGRYVQSAALAAAFVRPQAERSQLVCELFAAAVSGS